MSVDTQLINHRILGDFVRIHVVCNISALMFFLHKHMDLLDSPDSPVSSDDHKALLAKQDYESAARDEGWLRYSDLDPKLAAKALSQHGGVTPDFVRIGHMTRKRGEKVLSTCDCSSATWEMLCEIQDIEPYYIEAYEHWIVSDFLAQRLQEHDEMVAKNYFNWPVWGRATTGQSIALDSVIEQIASDMEILHGQKNEWKNE